MDPTAPPGTRGEIITFYSYKGGTGRTMALANVACLLAEHGGTRQSVLVVDWDLEAPGLHRFLPPRLASQNTGTDLGLDATPGLIDIFTTLSEKLPRDRPESEEAAEESVHAAFSSIVFESFIADTAVPGVSILRAGRNDDGSYSRRVNMFDWEDLFSRAPTVYRSFAERLGEMFRYVLIDSRTGVTDISGICTSLLPEKLVVVFTPNRQSLTGVRELVERATSYRRNSDDLRPLLIYPLPSRIEASLQDLRTMWRLGSRDRNVVGYQPMFEELFVKNYGLHECDLSAYFDEVQIQQTPDYAYGEEIAVRHGSDRFSLANSYRVFVDRLGSGMPPWARNEVDYGHMDAAEAAATAPRQTSVGQTSPAPSGRPGATPSPSVAVPTPPPDSFFYQTKPPGVFLSSAPEDRDRVRPIVAALTSQGFHVWDLKSIPAGSQFDRAVADALDGSDVVIVCWTKTSIGSESVLAEAGEGLRRGILVPVLLDDVHPPLGFRAIQSADLRRGVEGRMKTLVDAVSRIAYGSPGTVSTPPATVATSRRTPRSLRPWLAAAAGIVLAVSAVSLFRTRESSEQPPLPVETPTPTQSAAPPLSKPVEGVRVPDFKGEQTDNVRKAAGYLGLQIVFRDESGKESPSVEGVVVGQSPAANQQVARGSSLQLTVATATTTVPTVVGLTLDEAVVALDKARLRINTTGERPVPDVKPGTIVAQLPVAGGKAAVGSRIGVTIATPARR